MTNESADAAIDADSAAMLARLDDAFEADLEPIPADLIEAARVAFTWRLGEAELAELLFDSASEELDGVRGVSHDLRSFRYAAGGHVMRVHLTASSLVVMVEPPLVVACRLVTEEGTDEHTTDEFGEVVVEAHALPLRIEVDLPGGRVATPWITG